MPKSESHLRSLVKGLSWRATGTLDTILISLLVTHDFSTALKIGAVEVFTKIALYYGHERVWQRIGWGKPATQTNAWSQATPAKESPLRSVIKGISWRMTGTADTMLISYFITGNPLTALKIGGVEIFTKIVLYYFHERIWQKIGWGQPQGGDVATSPAHTVVAQ